jgi:hypothetical protein
MNRPDIEIHLDKTRYQPGDILVAEYSIAINRVDALNSITTLEASVLWETSGKGESDIGVHFFERKKSFTPQTIWRPHKISTVLPATPLSYDGRVLKIGWFIRVRLFFEDGHKSTTNEPFQLGNVCYFEPLTPETTEPNEPNQ